MLRSSLRYNGLPTPTSAAQLSATNTAATPKQIRASGRNVKKLLHGKTPRERAKVGAKLVTCEFAYVNPTPAQAARIVGTTAQRIHAALGHQPKPPSDTKIDRIIARYGADAIMRGL